MYHLKEKKKSKFSEENIGFFFVRSIPLGREKGVQVERKKNSKEQLSA